MASKKHLKPTTPSSQQQTLTLPSTTVAATETKRTKKKEKVCGGSVEAQPSTKKRPREVTSPNIKKWGDEDEIRLLQGIVECRAKTRKNPILDNNGTYEFVKESLSIDVNNHQFIGKMCNLKNRYFSKRDNGKELSFSNAHDQKTFELSKLIWGLENPKRSSERIKKMEEDKNPKKSSERIKKMEEDKKVMMIHEGEDWFYNSFMAKFITRLGLDEDFVKRGWSQVTVEKKKIIQEKWRVLINKEFEALAEKAELCYEVASAMGKHLLLN